MTTIFFELTLGMLHVIPRSMGDTIYGRTNKLIRRRRKKWFLSFHRGLYRFLLFAVAPASVAPVSGTILSIPSRRGSIHLLLPLLPLVLLLSGRRRRGRMRAETEIRKVYINNTNSSLIYPRKKRRQHATTTMMTMHNRVLIIRKGTMKLIPKNLKIG